jgi:hypothetical protein
MKGKKENMSYVLFPLLQLAEFQCIKRIHSHNEM